VAGIKLREVSQKQLCSTFDVRVGGANCKTRRRLRSLVLSMTVAALSRGLLARPGLAFPKLCRGRRLLGYLGYDRQGVSGWADSDGGGGLSSF
jgi:hypothetical protein